MKRTWMALVSLGLLATVGCAVSPTGGATPASTGAASAGAAAGMVTCDFRPGGEPAKAVDLPNGINVPASGTADMTITIGGQPVHLTLDRAAAPCTVASFESLAAQRYFDGTSCHRLATTGLFILQCGDPTGTGRGGPGYTFDDELEQTTGYPAGTLAMANAGPDTNGSQFFFVYADTDLPPAYTVFGHLDEASNQVIADRAFQGHDAQYPDGTGKPNLPTVIRSVVSG